MREEEGSEGSEDSRDGDADRRTRRAVSSRRQAFRLWKDAADRVRDVHCMRKVAECYLSGEGCRQANQAKAMRYLEKAADKGDRGAIMMLVRLYHEQAMDSLNGQEKRSSMKIEESARGIAKTEKIKTETQHREEDADDSPTSDEDDDETESQPETAHTRLYRYVRMGASDGDAMCISKLAYAQRHGLDGIEKNVPAALELYLEAASRGDVESRAAAADVFYHGEQGVPRDRARAFAMFAQCAREGWAPSFRALADCYRTGAGAPNDKPDLPLAHMYYTEAASLTPDATSLRILGDMHTTGLGCAKNLPLAFDLYDRAWSICSSSSDDADLEAGRCLARCYWFGRGVEKDRERAKEVWAALLSRAKGSMEREDVRRLEGMDDAGFEEILAVVNE
ncbi:uncharacterized protein EV422DRAFT_537991 [Fimicolochytrium jonesii]|uniref:uncharacterized protein n=1 Tax=Fimicolochytrium jonesii TaxID=1396493 RepID=UPI0022FEE438|nr:uncharacterized protein EV422DRAFT_537991 [Fimicolochytrium jonesii]KAI8818293.1 hypothetical protein EV422DRAFT_537991 [Fimicolochytrium jonesii]